MLTLQMRKCDYVKSNDHMQGAVSNDGISEAPLCRNVSCSPNVLSSQQLMPITFGILSHYHLIYGCWPQKDDFLGISGTILLHCI